MYRRQVIQTFMETGLKTDHDVLMFLAATDVAVVGTKHICGQADHVPAFRAFSDVIRDLYRHYIIWASRSGSKTFLYGGLDTWYKCVTKKRYEVKILGGSGDQSLLSYEALKTFRDVCDPDGIYVKRLLVTKGTFRDDSSVSILKASSRSDVGRIHNV